MATEAHDRTFDIFLSHSHVYTNWVENLARQLKDIAGFNVWLDKWRLVPGRPFISGMSNGMEQAKTCAVCVGAHSPRGWFRAEIHKALNQQMEDPSFGVIPVLLPDAEEVNVNEFLELNTWVDFRNNNSSFAFYVLICGIKGIEPNAWEPAMKTGTAAAQNLNALLRELERLEKLGIIHPKVAKEKRRQLLSNL